ncbi:hypothetical protein KC323_g158 [Hortaea werneckii]|nr:hypothetical protein KC323_g158 [Hortaea werneckii]
MASIEPHQLENSLYQSTFRSIHRVTTVVERAVSCMFDAPGSVLHVEGSQQLARQIKVRDLIARVDVVDLSYLSSRRGIFFCAGHPRGSTEASFAEGVCAEHSRTITAGSRKLFTYARALLCQISCVFLDLTVNLVTDVSKFGIFEAGISFVLSMFTSSNVRAHSNRRGYGQQDGRQCRCELEIWSAFEHPGVVEGAAVIQLVEGDDIVLRVLDNQMSDQPRCYEAFSSGDQYVSHIRKRSAATLAEQIRVPTRGGGSLRHAATIAFGFHGMHKEDLALLDSCASSQKPKRSTWTTRRKAAMQMRNRLSCLSRNVLVNIGAAVGLVFVNKRIFEDEALRHAQVTFAALHFAITAATLYAVSVPRIGMFQRKRVPVLGILPLALAMIASVVLTNASLAFSSIQFYQVARVLTTPCVALLEYVVLGKKITIRASLTLIPVCVGLVRYCDLLVHSFYLTRRL